MTSSYSDQRPLRHGRHMLFGRTIERKTIACPSTMGFSVPVAPKKGLWGKGAISGGGGDVTLITLTYIHPTWKPTVISERAIKGLLIDDMYQA